MAWSIAASVFLSCLMEATSRLNRIMMPCWARISFRRASCFLTSSICSRLMLSKSRLPIAPEGDPSDMPSLMAEAAP